MTSDAIMMKLGRASALAHEVAEFAESWLAENPIHIRETYTDQGSEFHVLKQDGPPAGIGLPFSECVHHARSALDHTIWRLAEAGGTAPRRQFFPICKSEGSFKDAVKKRGALAGLSDNATELVRLVQPYSFNPANPRLPHLWVLHKLSNADKHHFLQPYAPTLAPQEQFRTWQVIGPLGFSGRQQWWDYPNRVTDRDIDVVKVFYPMTSQRPPLTLMPGPDARDLVVIAKADDKDDSPSDPPVFLRLSWLPRVVDHVTQVCGALLDADLDVRDFHVAAP